MMKGNFKRITMFDIKKVLKNILIIIITFFSITIFLRLLFGKKSIIIDNWHDNCYSISINNREVDFESNGEENIWVLPPFLEIIKRRSWTPCNENLVFEMNNKFINEIEYEKNMQLKITEYSCYNIYKNISREEKTSCFREYTKKEKTNKIRKYTIEIGEMNNQDTDTYSTITKEIYEGTIHTNETIDLSKYLEKGKFYQILYKSNDKNEETYTKIVVR